ncbi:MAG: extracellular solute-binding protein [Lachnospiraceae bacterium]|jgi:raffinose/stachyose/melibiose transport system substrate-binding protein|nr:extracellular solute-binding protein [Lachnospiraceae bacterium]
MLKKSVAGILSVCMVLMLTACGKGQEQKPAVGESSEIQASGEGVVKIPIILTTGTNDSQDIQMRAIVEDFNREYEGVYQMEPEYLAGSSDDYRSKLKMLNASNSMPALIQVGPEPAFYELLVENDCLVNVAPYLEADGEWKSRLMPQGLQEFLREDGSMYMIPSSGMQLTGIYYNKELFEKAGIGEFPKTWDAFWEACEKLKENNIPALSLHTTETAWCPMLLSTAYLGASEAGRTFMDQQFPDDFETVEVKEAMELLIRQFQYTTPDAVGGTYALAANNFFSGNTAMIANGPWMMPSLTDEDYAEAGFAEKVGYAPFPENVMVGSMEQTSWCVTTDQGEAAAEGAIAFMKFYSREAYAQKRAVESGEFSSVVEIPQEDYDAMSSTMKECVDVTSDVDVVLPSYQTKWDPVIQNDVFGREIPNLVSGAISVDQFIEMLNQGAAQYKEDIQ